MNHARIAAVVGSVCLFGWAPASAQGALPTAFGKIAPVHGTTTASVAPTLSWSASSGATSYEYCFDTTNDNACSTWRQTGSPTSAAPTGLAAGTTYYWQVRARNANGTTYADGIAGAFWTFATPASAPMSFAKITPWDGASGQNVSQTLGWYPSPGAASYEYCIDSTNDNTCAGWISTGASTTAPLSLTPGTSYYWSVRATNAFGTTYADGGAFWAFATQSLPAAFTRIGPANGAMGLPMSVTLSWNPTAGATNYQYCLDTTNDNSCTNWGFNSTNTSITRSNLLAGTTYYWHVRANNAGGATYAEGSASAFWSFTTTGNPGSFGKSGPSNGQLGVPLIPSISWQSSSGSTGFEYCYDTTNDNTCANWIATSGTSASLAGLSPSTTYYWQVRAPTALGVTYADGDPQAFWSFTTALVLLPPPCNVLSLNGNSAYAAAATSVFPVSGAPGSFTVEAWIWPQPHGPFSYGYEGIVSDDAYALFLEESFTGIYQLGVALKPTGVSDFLHAYKGSRYLSLYQWHHVLLVYDDSTKTMALGLDGVLDAPFPVANIDFTPLGRNLNVGAFASTYPLAGLVDNVRISRVARYSAPFTPSSSFVNDADTVALYHFAEPNGATTFTDESGNGHTLTGIGGAQATLDYNNCVDPNGPTVTGITPNSGSMHGGTLVTITGTGFVPGATVSIGGSPATNVTVNNATSITATTSAHVQGTFTLVVTNPDTTWGALVDAFTYFRPPPAAFGKTGPATGATGLSTVTLSWNASSDVDRYEYCIDTTNDNFCAFWIPTGAGLPTSVAATGLASGTTYYWQVRAVSLFGATYADSGATDFWSFTTGTVPPLPDFRDFNGDGKPDLLWEHGSGARYAWFMNGTTMTSGAFLSPNPMDPTLRIAGVNDFTGDGKPDLLMQSTIDGTVTLYHMDGLNHVASQAIQTQPNVPWAVVATGDFNGDAKPDIVWQNFSTRQVYVWFMSSAGGAAMYGGAGGVFAGEYIRDYTGLAINAGAASMRIVGTADLDQDHNTDLVWQDQATGALRYSPLIGTVVRFAGLISPAAVDPNWKLKVVGDYNADGKADFIFQHTNGSLYAWFMDGAMFTSGAYLTPGAVNPAWQLVGPR